MDMDTDMGIGVGVDVGAALEGDHVTDLQTRAGMG